MNDQEMEQRLVALEQPGNLAAPPSAADLWLMVIIALVIPVAALAIAWGW